MKRWLSIGTFLTLAIITCAAQNCARSGAPGWSKQLRELYADCNNTIAAPDGRMVALVNKDGDISLQLAGQVISTSATISAPGVLSWSPGSPAFFLNDGEGSGMSSRFRLFHVEGAGAQESSEIEKKIVRSYKQRNRCGDLQADPNIYGIGWSLNGEQIYLIAQSTVNGPCGRADRFLGYIANTSNERIIAHLTTQQAKTRFKRLLPHALLDSN